MKFKKIFISIYSLICIFISLNAKQISPKEIAPYVYPNNLVKSIGDMHFMPDGTTYLGLSSNKKMIVQYATESGLPIDTILNAAKTREYTIDKINGFLISPDGSKLLVYNDVSPIYRRSFEAQYYVFEIKRNILKPLSANHKKQRSPIFSYDGRMVAFVSNNNIYIKKIDYDSEVAVTTDGKSNSIINGVPDWTYEEEFMVETSMAWSPDNLTLCFIKYNETEVKTYSFPLYGGVYNKDREKELYPGEYTYKYPKSGGQNTKVSVHSYDVETRKIKNIPLNDKYIEYIPRILYANNSNALIITTLNRNQNRLELLLANPKTTIVKSLYVDESKTWIEDVCYNNIKFMPDYFVISSSKTGYNHLYKYSYAGVELSQLTKGSFDVLSYYGCDKNENHYYQSTKNGAINKVVTKIDKKKGEIDLSQAFGTANAVFSPTMNYYIINYSNTNTPPTYELYNIQNKRVRTIEDNSGLKAKYQNLPKREFITITNDGIELNGYIIKPQGFSSSVKYPVIMTLYNGPSSQSVLDKWSIDWENYFATQGYIIVCVDGRGTGGRGDNFKGVVYKKLGYYETNDQIAAANYIASLPYVDENKIGIYGWSYGGYETLMAISHEKSPYKAAVAIAPVSDWRFYDTAYTERFMQTPQENEDGYKESSALNKINNVNCPLLIMSGTSDDNVHLSNTMEYVSQLIKEGKYCDLFLFPNMNHSINERDARAVVYAKMLDFFNKNLNVNN